MSLFFPVLNFMSLSPLSERKVENTNGNDGIKTKSIKPSDMSENDLLIQLTEESSELSFASAKLCRSIGGTNPSPKSLEQCFDDLIEEIADVYLVSQIVLDKLESKCDNALTDKIKETIEKKYNRLVSRLNDK